MDKYSAYKSIFIILDKCWKSKRSQDLGDLLSDAKPTSIDGLVISGDPGTYAGYSELWDKKIGSDKTATRQEAFDLFKESVLDYYANKVHYEISYAEDYLREQFLGETTE